MKEGKCFYCKEVGHVASVCPRKKAADLKLMEEALQETSAEQGKDRP